MGKVEHFNLKLGLVSFGYERIGMNRPGNTRVKLDLNLETPYLSVAEIDVETLVIVIPLR